ncbi:tRNA1(Val) (adenine(37)-N6)-methyltransferase [Vibrio sonorensis]|uniref:tRNA1(Val) (adenine(37)-N6)-methyltransferase n=1 Tax=Vibrio sonorensis TaxID=1004316 RepID=UPI0008DAF702|nr:methyltransferase [Vibrio sonorensis]
MKENIRRTKGFDFKQFSISESYAGMPVSTDGVLLGAWCQLTQMGRVLDIGTGTGLLALMAAQREQNAQIDAIDIDQFSIQAATKNIEQSPWSKRIKIFHTDLCKFSPNALYDSIVCNPPYFNSGETAKSDQRAKARHTDTLPHHTLIERCSQLLTESGSASFVLPVPEGETFIRLCENAGLHLQRRCDVQPNEVKQANRLLFQVGKSEVTPKEETLIIRQNGQYSQAFVHLTNAFYLKM